MNHLRKIGHPDFQPKSKSAPKTNTTSANTANDYEFNQKCSQTSKEPKKIQSKKSSSNDLKLTKTGAVIGGVLGLGLGAIVGKPIIGAIIGAGILGVLGFTKDNK